MEMEGGKTGATLGTTPGRLYKNENKKKKEKISKDTLLQFTEMHQTQKKKGNGFNDLRILQHTHAYYIYVHYIYMDI